MNLPKIEITTKEKPQAVVLGWFAADEADKGKKKGKKEKSKQEKGSAAPVFRGKRSELTDNLTNQLQQSAHFTGKKNTVDVLRYYTTGDYPNVMLVGLGNSKKWNAEMVRQAGAAISLAQRKEKFSYVAVQMDGILSTAPQTEANYFLQAFCEGYLLAIYDFDQYKKKDENKFEIKGVQLLGLPKGATPQKIIQKATLLCRAVNFARSLGDQPGNHLTPTILANKLSEMAKKNGLHCTLWNKARLEKEKMGLFIGVAKGSAEEPRLILLEYKGTKKAGRPIALVGKAITFDTGGISLKPASHMEEMKYDMMGAATVAGIMLAAALLKLPVHLKAYIAAAENMPSGTAQKPGDIAFSRSGKSVEIINTDAEGRLVLADVLEYAQESKPQAIVDFATLTGAVLVALGTTVSGIMGNSSDLINRMRKSAEHTSERVWELPLYEEIENLMKSDFADIKNSSDVREAGSSKGGAFLKFFVDNDVPWVHCDIAGTAWARKDVNYHPRKFASGAMVRSMTHLLENWKTLARGA